MRLLALSLFALSLQAQPWSGIIDSSRAMDWSTVGATIDNTRTQCVTVACNTVTSAGPSSTAAQINAAIASAPGGTYVLLPAGNYSLSAGITLGTDNVTLRGAGPKQTILSFSAGSSCGLIGTGMVCAPGPDIDYDNGVSRVSWTAAGNTPNVYARGATTATISGGSARPSVGALLMLDQLTDGASLAADTFPDVFSCITSTSCAQSGAGNARDQASADVPGRDLLQIVYITAITAVGGGACTTLVDCTVTFTPPLFSDHFKTANTPQAWWATGASPLVGVGLENLRLTNNAAGISLGVGYRSTYNSWIKNVQIDGNAAARGVTFRLSLQVTLRDSYIWGATNSADRYALDCFVCGFDRVENNILAHWTTGFESEMGFVEVLAHNYVANDLTNINGGTTGFLQLGFQNHGGDAFYWLLEGNDGWGTGFDNYYGGAHFATMFRNRFSGFLSGLISGAAQQTIPAFNYSMYRFSNWIGNVLGTSGYHTTYETNTANFTTSNACQFSIYVLGLGGNCNTVAGADDVHVAGTIMRWGNWDVVHSANVNSTNDSTGTRFVSAEVPSGLSKYANAVPASQSLPASFLYASQPTWWPNSIPWPAIGPDVSSGTQSATGGHAYKNPARACFETTMGATITDTSPSSLFDASVCYASTSLRGPHATAGTRTGAGSIAN